MDSKDSVWNDIYSDDLTKFVGSVVVVCNDCEDALEKIFAKKQVTYQTTDTLGHKIGILKRARTSFDYVDDYDFSRAIEYLEIVNRWVKLAKHASASSVPQETKTEAERLKGIAFMTREGKPFVLTEDMLHGCYRVTGYALHHLHTKFIDPLDYPDRYR